MSWYVGKDGRKVWAERDETVFTVSEPEEVLPKEILTYLATNLNKPVYAEHTIDEDAGGKKTKKAKEKQAGRQRGFVVRVDQDDRIRVCAAFRPAAEKLLASGLVSRLDVDDSSSSSSRKKKKQEKEEPELQTQSLLATLGVNECRIDTTARCQHNAHGSGFRLEVAEGGQQQRIHVFTARDLTAADWHGRLVEAVEGTGSRVMMGRILDAEPPEGAGGKPGKARDEARKDEDDWLASVLGRCMVSKEKESGGAGGDGDGKTSEGAEEGASGQAGADGEAAEGAPKKAAAVLPPWLRRA